MTEQKRKITDDDRKKADEEIRELQKQIDYDTKDFTIELLVQKFEKNDFFIPNYQRAFIWRSDNKNFFLESVLLGLPIPFMFFADCKDGRQEIIDGAQRMQTLVEFTKGSLQIQGLKKLKHLNGFKFTDLSEAQQRKFRNRTLRIIVLDEDIPASSRQELFYRINATGVKANASEIRRGSYPGPLTDFIDKCSQNELFDKLCPISEGREKRYERFELVLRFFAYTYDYQKFGHKVSDFLNNFLVTNLKTFDREAYKQDFDNMLKFVDTYFPNGFAKSPKAASTPRVRFEAISVGVALALRENPSLKVSNVDWLDGDEFKNLTTSDASNNEGRLKARIEYVRNQLLGVKNG